MLLYNHNYQLLKLISNFKHISFKTLVNLAVNKDLPKDLIFRRSEDLSEIINCNIHTAREIIIKNENIANLKDFDFQKNARFCSLYFKLSHIIESPSILTLQPSILQHRYFSLKELGFYHVSPSYLLRFPFLLKELPKDLKRKGYHIDFERKSEPLIKYFDSTNLKEIRKNIQHMYQDGSNLQKIKEVMNAAFFSSKLECSIGKANQMLHRYATLRIQSICLTNELLNVLLWKLGLPLSKIFNSVRMLSVHHESVENFISEIPEILGVNTVDFIIKIPALLKQPIDSIRSIEASLRKFNVTKDQLLSCPKALLISPDTLHERLNFICNTEELLALRSTKKFLWLAYYYKNLKPRLERLKNENLTCSMNLLTATFDKFEKSVLYKNARSSMREEYSYLASVFNMTEKEIYTRLHRHPSAQRDIKSFSPLNCRKIVEFLLLSDVSKEQIFNGLEIIFYDADIVKIYFKNLKNHHACQPFEDWVTHYNLVQLLIYTIEITEYH